MRLCLLSQPGSTAWNSGSLPSKLLITFCILSKPQSSLRFPISPRAHAARLVLPSQAPSKTKILCLPSFRHPCFQVRLYTKMSPIQMLKPSSMKNIARQTTPPHDNCFRLGERVIAFHKVL
ncbi:hypothetical protein FGO68_gene7801 [Halteria grandinella]|uniref:Uncharacterized protein n=1 Tax=Halteria grandinella TaxID=5974 RepID=A0A8J8NSF5_HALGN|nr:hypothetical protein FGO68_gene7801 [Halteria grandinella]